MSSRTRYCEHERGARRRARRRCSRSRRFDAARRSSASSALLNDPAVYERAAADPQAWWVEQAEQLDWFQKWTRVLDDDDPPFYKWFTGGTLNVSYNCLDRHVIAGRGERVAFHWRGEDGPGARHHLRRAARRGRALRQRAEGPGRAEGRRRRHLPADDPRGRRRDARVRAHRRAAQRRLRRLLRRGRARADGVLRGEGADHRRRRRAQGQDRAGQGSRRRGDGRPRRRSRRSSSCAARAPTVPDEGRARRLLRRDLRRRRPGVPGRAARRRAPAVHPLHLRLDRQAEGHPAHDRRLPDRRLGDAPLRVRPQARVRRVLVRGRRRLGHRALLHRLRPALQRRHLGDVGGRARLPRQGHLVGDRRALRRDASSTARRPRSAPASSGAREWPEQARPRQPAAARLGRRADQPEGVALVPQGDRRRTLPDRRHLVADRDRRDHDHAAARDHRDQAGLGDAARSPACSPRCATSRPASRSRRARACSC